MLFLLISVLLGTAGCRANAPLNSWLTATKVVPVEMVEAVIAENSQLNPQESASDLLAWSVEGKAGKLVIFNFGNSDLCSKNNCLYLGYLIKNNVPPIRVFSSYLNPNLPLNKLLFQVTNDSAKDSDLPCLQLQQLSDANIRQLVFCFNGREYQLTKSYLIEM